VFSGRRSRNLYDLVSVATGEVERRAAEVEQVTERVAVPPGAEDIVDANRERVAGSVVLFCGCGVLCRGCLFLLRGRVVWTASWRLGTYGCFMDFFGGQLDNKVGMGR
jgi:hypothetical protein